MIISSIIGFIYRKILRPVLFLFDPELIHDSFIWVGKVLSSNGFTKFCTRKIFKFSDNLLKQKILGINFENPVGLSAGFDKDGYLHNILSDVGFGFVETGSTTFGMYEGNPKPRLKRDKKNKSIWVNYGLKNDGVDVLISRLKIQKDKGFVVGVSVAKTNCRATANVKEGVVDYINTIKELEKANVAKFYTINISCPNAFGGEPFTDPAFFEMFLRDFKQLGVKKPVFVKMPIDLTWTDFARLLDLALKYGIDGVVIGNLNKEKGTKTGGYSGKRCFDTALSLVKKTYEKCGDKLVIVGVGGIFSAEDAYEMIKGGASLLELITGMIYQGPQLIGEINRGLVKKMEEKGVKSLSELRGLK